MNKACATDYPLNAWYAAAWDKDLGRTPLARTICGVPVVLYRAVERTAVALEDACLHRLLPLSMGLNTVTPASERRCYYFFGYRRSFMLNSRELDAELLAANIRIFTEDKVILEAQQKAIDAFPERRLLNLNIDKGSMAARHAIQRMIERDRQSADVPEAAQ